VSEMKWIRCHWPCNHFCCRSQIWSSEFRMRTVAWSSSWVSHSFNNLL